MDSELEILNKEEIKKIRKLEFTKFTLPVVNNQFIMKEFYICPKCRDYKSTKYNMFGSDTLIDIYKIRKEETCSLCKSNSSINEQKYLLENLIEIISNNTFNNVYQILGSKISNGTVIMKDNQINDIYFNEMGIPSNAKILDIHLTSGSNLLPLKLMINNPRHSWDITDNIFSFYPANIYNIDKTVNDKNNLSIMVQWISYNENNIIDKNLLDAMDNYIDNKPFELIMNANRSLELICNKICYKEFVKNSNTRKGKKSVGDFLVTGATYGHQLKYLINLISKANSTIMIEKEIIDKIDNIRKLRNDIAHRGNLKNDRELSAQEKIEILSIAILGSSIMKYILSQI